MGGEVPNRRHYRFYDFFMVAFVTVLLCSNLIGPGKTCKVLGVTFGAGNLFFPISYIFGDVLTEVYGFARARKVIWAGFGAMIFATIMGQFVIHAPVDPDEPFNKVMQPALEVVFGNTWRIVVGSIIAFWVGDFANCYVMAKMKVLDEGQAPVDAHDRLDDRRPGGRQRAVLSDRVLRDLGARHARRRRRCSTGRSRSLVEVVFTPVTYAVVGWLKKAEHEDYFDNKTEFTPFSLSRLAVPRGSTAAPGVADLRGACCLLWLDACVALALILVSARCVAAAATTMRRHPTVPPPGCPMHSPARPRHRRRRRARADDERHDPRCARRDDCTRTSASRTRRRRPVPAVRPARRARVPERRGRTRPRSGPSARSSPTTARSGAARIASTSTCGRLPPPKRRAR